MSEDPIEFEGSDLNLYAYVFNSPTNYTDPDGEFVPQLIGCAVGAGISVGADLLSGRKIDLTDAAIGCGMGTTGGYYTTIYNANRYLRIGYGRHEGRVSRIAGKWVTKITGKPHIDLWR